MNAKPLLAFDPTTFLRDYDREPFAIEHRLAALRLFDEDRLRALLARFADHPEDYYVAASAPAPDTEFFSVPGVALDPLTAFDRLAQAPQRILLKRPERHDPDFRGLMQRLFDEIAAARGGLARGERLVRIETGIFISSGATITPFHFDPELNFFAQIQGEKTYHVYSPRCLGEHELERFYVQGQVQIGQVDLAGREPRHEHVFRLAPGRGHHQPQNAPHWVETGTARSISYALVFETNRTRAVGRAIGFNHYLRRAGLTPAGVGARPGLDAVKAASMRLITPTRRAAVTLRGLMRRA